MSLKFYGISFGKSNQVIDDEDYPFFTLIPTLQIWPYKSTEKEYKYVPIGDFGRKDKVFTGRKCTYIHLDCEISFLFWTLSWNIEYKSKMKLCRTGV